MCHMYKSSITKLKKLIERKHPTVNISQNVVILSNNNDNEISEDFIDGAITINEKSAKSEQYYRYLFYKQIKPEQESI